MEKNPKIFCTENRKIKIISTIISYIITFFAPIDYSVPSSVGYNPTL